MRLGNISGNDTNMGDSITYYNSHYSFISEKKHRKMKYEIQLREIDKAEEPDWEGMGVDRPKGKRKYKYRRCWLDTYDIEYIKEYDDTHSIIKLTWMEDAAICLKGYDELCLEINDLENARLGEDDE